MNTNIALLTRSHSLIAAKKNAKRTQVKEVVFDDDARREFLTGFHKRKLAKAEAARAKAKQREKQERLEARREQRRLLREQAIQNATQVEKAYGALIDDDADEWDGVSPADDADNIRDDEYQDEEMLATVTVVEDFDPDTIIHGPPKPDASTESYSTPSSQPPSSSKKSKPKVKERKIRYETKDARMREQKKQRKRRSEKAELAGGKASRKPSSGGKRKHGSKR
ncbi:nucleolar protein 12-domain-containing protein [Flammula alnicola]|nr:nucleolar protein 12-domain-containing protein [Flammula alnicola]